jgi:hypothetical protein
MSLLDLAQQHIGPADVQQISQQLGADPGTTQKAIDAALPMMLGGMASTAQQPGGESALHGALGGLSGMLGGGNGGAMGGILGSILGQHQSTVQDGVQQASGLDAGKAGKLLILLAPFVLRALAKHQESAGTQHGGGLGDVLQREAQKAQTSAAAQSPQVGGMLGKILGGLGG